ncbi:MAG: hypothetical protein AMXMBFR25_30720 [Lysobacterales bacterium]
MRQAVSPSNTNNPHQPLNPPEAVPTKGPSCGGLSKQNAPAAAPICCKINGSTSFRGPIAMKIRPLHDRVIIKRMEEERVSAGGIVIPDSATEKPVRGEVIAAGNGKILENGGVRPIAVKAGDKVLFGKYSGTEVKVDGEELLVMREEDIMGVIEA